MENNQNKTFQYTYSAKEQAKIKEIRSKYLPREASKMEQLQKMDAAPTQKAVSLSLAVGIAGALILGAGMSCCMVWGGDWLVPGIIVGLAGMVIVSVAYPLYTHVLKKERERIAPEILRLTDELMK